MGSFRTSRVLWLMRGIWHRLHGFGVRMLILPILILVQSSSAKGPHPLTTMLYSTDPDTWHADVRAPNENHGNATEKDIRMEKRDTFGPGRKSPMTTIRSNLWIVGLVILLLAPRSWRLNRETDVRQGCTVADKCLLVH